MNNQSITELRLDCRLHRRRGWIAEQDLQVELDALPDVSEKIRSSDTDEPFAQSNAAAPATPAAQTAAPASGPPTLPEGGGV